MSALAFLLERIQRSSDGRLVIGSQHVAELFAEPHAVTLRRIAAARAALWRWAGCFRTQAPSPGAAAAATVRAPWRFRAVDLTETGLCLLLIDLAGGGRRGAEGARPWLLLCTEAFRQAERRTAAASSQPIEAHA